jgi:CheY-like chemotaxis protein
MCILVVEDDFLIRNILVEELLDAGYVVREAASGDQAVELLKTIDPPLTVLVTDIHMPGSCDGLDLAAHVRDRLPAVPVIYTTGRPDALKVAGHLDRQQSLVRKPYVPSEIIERIQDLLEG